MAADLCGFNLALVASFQIKYSFHFVKSEFQYEFYRPEPLTEAGEEARIEE